MSDSSVHISSSRDQRTDHCFDLLLIALLPAEIGRRQNVTLTQPIRNAKCVTPTVLLMAIVPRRKSSAVRDALIGLTSTSAYAHALFNSEHAERHTRIGST